MQVQTVETPTVLYYTEGNETYSVDAAGFIGRPVLGMKPSGGWRFTGIANGYGTRLATFPELVRALLAGEPLPKGGACVADLDHGTRRLHGSKAKRIWLATDHRIPGDEALELVERLHLERLESEREAWRQRNADNRARCDRATPAIYADERYGISLYRLSAEEWGLVDGGAVQIGLTYAEACGALGGALIEAAEST